MLIVFLCSSCGKQIEVPLPTLRQPFLNQDSTSTDFLPVAVVCPHCKIVEIQGQESVYMTVAKDSPCLLEWHSDDVLLECDMEDCKALLPLVYGWNDSTTEEERRADIATWRGKRMLCPQGHSICLPKFLL